MKFIIKTMEGLEPVLATELETLGGDEIEILNRAVACTGNKMLLYKANYQLRTALKVLVFLKEFTVRNEHDLYNEVKKINWSEYFSLENTFAIDAVVNSTIFNHANFIALKTKDAIADYFREISGARPNVDSKDPDMKINVHIRENIVTLSLDSSGSSLHLRGYRRQQVDAPLNEVLAAGMVLLSEWNATTPLIDPMCGSGTILCEAARIAGNIPPQDSEREFTFKRWNNFDEELWDQVCRNAMDEATPESIPEIRGYDISPRALEVSRANIELAGLSDYIQLGHEDFFYQDSYENITLIFNPPYDERMKEKDILTFYKDIGDKLKRSFTNCTAWILSGHHEAIKNLGLRPSARKKLLNGSIPSVFYKYVLYQGSKKQKWQNLSNDDSK